MKNYKYRENNNYLGRLSVNDNNNNNNNNIYIIYTLSTKLYTYTQNFIYYIRTHGFCHSDFMKTKKVMRLLGVSRSTLYYYKTNGKIRCTKNRHNIVDWNAEDVHNLVDNKFKMYVYTRNENEDKQLDICLDYLMKIPMHPNYEHIHDNGEIKDMTPWLYETKMKGLARILEDVLDRKIISIIVANKDVLGNDESIALLMAMCSFAGVEVEIVA